MRRKAQAAASTWITRSSHTRAEVRGSATLIVLSAGMCFVRPLPTVPGSAGFSPALLVSPDRSGFPRSRSGRDARAPSGEVGRARRSQMSNLPADQKMIEGIETAAVNKEIERRDRPHQGVFEAKCIPEIA